MDIQKNLTDNNTDIIKMKIDTNIRDKNGNLIEIKVPRPEYSSEIFSLKISHKKGDA